MVENDVMGDEMAEKKEETIPLSFSVATSLVLRVALFAFDASDLWLLTLPLVPANDDENEAFMDALQNRDGRGSRL